MKIKSNPLAIKSGDVIEFKSKSQSRRLSVQLGDENEKKNNNSGIKLILKLNNQQQSILRGIVAWYILYHSTNDTEDKALAETMKDVWKQMH
jgi:hypothetical protein